VNGYTGALLNRKPNFNPANGSGASSPFRLNPQAATADQDRDYTAEQSFPCWSAGSFPKIYGHFRVPPAEEGTAGTQGLAARYFDENTVTAHGTMHNTSLRDNSFGTTFGPSTPGAINLISGQTNEAFPQ
jgi:phospholipase C